MYLLVRSKHEEVKQELGLTVYYSTLIKQREQQI